MNISTAVTFFCLIAVTTARDVGRGSPVEPDVTPAAVQPIVVEVEDPAMIEAIAAELTNETVNLEDINLDDVTVEVTEGKADQITSRTKRHIGPLGVIVVKLLLKGKIIAHYVFKIVSGFSTGVLHGLIG